MPPCTGSTAELRRGARQVGLSEGWGKRRLHFLSRYTTTMSTWGEQVFFGSRYATTA